MSYTIHNWERELEARAAEAKVSAERERLAGILEVYLEAMKKKVFLLGMVCGAVGAAVVLGLAAVVHLWK
jgi:hypothetical protein